jgi:hypothetical protein
MLNLKSKCNCQSYESAVKVKGELAALEDETRQHKKMLHLARVADELVEAKRKHEQDKAEYMKNVIEFAKKRDLNVGPRSKRIKTVPWTVEK